MNLLALDIGGANLKAADGLGYATSRFFPLWQQPGQLAAALRSLVEASPRADHLAVTMTGELADCYPTKRDGVREILGAVAAVADGRTIHVYQVDGALASVAAALQDPLLAAASNWHALARFATRFAPVGVGLAIDVGSTTTDLVPLRNGQVVAHGRSDPERLACGELVYSGVERSPICAIVRQIPWRGATCPIAQELFATARDAYLMLGELPEDADDRNTADGRPATRDCAWDRLARMICGDREMFSRDDALAAAITVCDAQLELLASAAEKVLTRLGSPPTTVVLSGQGEFLARELLERMSVTGKTISLNDELGPQVSRAATAHALAVVARESLAGAG